MRKRITLLMVALVMVSMIASAPLNAAVGFRVYVGPGAFVRPVHPYWYSYPAPYYAPYPGYPYVYYYSRPAYPYYGHTYHWEHHRHHEWRHHYRR